VKGAEKLWVLRPCKCWNRIQEDEFDFASPQIRLSKNAKGAAFQTPTVITQRSLERESMLEAKDMLEPTPRGPNAGIQSEQQAIPHQDRKRFNLLTPRNSRNKGASSSSPLRRRAAAVRVQG
jgi:hypothetical protein